MPLKLVSNKERKAWLLMCCGVGGPSVGTAASLALVAACSAYSSRLLAIAAAMRVPGAQAGLVCHLAVMRAVSSEGAGDDHAATIRRVAGRFWAVSHPPADGSTDTALSHAAASLDGLVAAVPVASAKQSKIAAALDALVLRFKSPEGLSLMSVAQLEVLCDDVGIARSGKTEVKIKRLHLAADEHEKKVAPPVAVRPDLLATQLLELEAFALAMAFFLFCRELLMRVSHVSPPGPDGRQAVEVADVLAVLEQRNGHTPLFCGEECGKGFFLATRMAVRAAEVKATKPGKKRAPKAAAALEDEMGKGDKENQNDD